MGNRLEIPGKSSKQKQHVIPRIHEEPIQHWSRHSEQTSPLSHALLSRERQTAEHVCRWTEILSFVTVRMMMCWDHYSKWNEPGPQTQALCALTCVWNPKKGGHVEVEIGLVVTRSWGEERRRGFGEGLTDVQCTGIKQEQRFQVCYWIITWL